MTTLYIWTNKRSGQKTILVHSRTSRITDTSKLKYTDVLFDCEMVDFNDLVDKYNIIASLERDVDVIVNVLNKSELKSIKQNILDYNKKANVITKLYTLEGIITYKNKIGD